MVKSKCIARSSRGAALLVAALLLAGCATQPAPTAPPPSAAARVAQEEAVYPPWQNGRNNGATKRGFVFTVAPADVLSDFHGSTSNPKLVLYIAGNYYFALAPLVEAFGRAYPQYRGGVYYETLPPGILRQQMNAGGTITVGNMTWTAKPDVFLGGLKTVRSLIAEGRLAGPPVAYVTNDLTIMIPAGNPGNVRGLADLGRADLPVVMPNPRYEGVARQIRASLVKAGGEPLAKAVYETKVQTGQTVLTHIHHRETPLWIMEGFGQAGVTWKSEAIFQEQVGHPIAHVDIPAADNTTAIYAGAIIKGTPHRKAAEAWLRFIRSDVAIAIFERYGFKRYSTPGAKGVE